MQTTPFNTLDGPVRIFNTHTEMQAATPAFLGQIFISLDGYFAIPRGYDAGHDLDSITIAGTFNSLILGDVNALTVLGALRLSGGVSENSDLLTGTGALGAVSLTTPLTRIITTGAATGTMASALISGQKKRIYMGIDAGDFVLTVTNLEGGTTITFDAQDDFIDLQFIQFKWKVIINNGCVIA